MDELTKKSEDAVLAANKLAVENIRKEHFDHAMFYLNQALLTARAMKESSKKYNLLAMTYNNLGCYLKRSHKLKQALEYFLKASELSRSYDDNIANLTCSHLNISKIYSEQNDHEKALRHGLKSLFLLRHNFAEKKSLVSSLIIAYQTVGLEYRFLNQDLDSLECFETGLALSVKHLGKKHEVTLALSNCFKEATGRTASSKGNFNKRNSTKSSCKSYSNEVEKKNNSRKKNPQNRGLSAVVQKRKEVWGVERLPISRLKKVNSKVFEKNFRGNEGRKYRKIDKDAAIIIQRWWKGACAGKIRRRKYAAVKIQRWWRNLLMRKREEKMRVRNRISKRFVIKQRTKGLHSSMNEEQMKSLISENEKIIMRGSTGLLVENNKKKQGRSQKNELAEEIKQLENQKDSKEKLNSLAKYKEFGVSNKNRYYGNSKEINYHYKYEESAKTPEKFQKIPEKIPEKISEKNPKKIPEKIPEKNLEKISEKISEKIREKIPEKIPKRTPEKIPLPVKLIPTHVQKSPIIENPPKSVPFLNEITERTELITKPISNRRNFLINRRPDITQQMNSLLKVQSFIRMVVPRLNYWKMRKACIKIQKTFKGRKIRILYQAIRDAVIFIQFMYKKSKSKAKAKKRIN